MKVNSIRNFKYFAGIVLFIAGTTAMAIYRDNKAVEKIKQEVLEKDSVRYKRALEKEKSNYHYNQKYFWINERNKMNDSLKTNSIVQKAYFDGMQAVRDSIKNAEKQ